MAFSEAFDKLWAAYQEDLNFDAILASEAALVTSCEVEDVRRLLEKALDTSSSGLNLHGTSLAALFLESLPAELNAKDATSRALSGLTDAETIEDLKIDFPLAPQHLREVESLLEIGGARRRLRVLAVRNGFSPDADCAKALRDVVHLRIPASPHVVATGNEDAQGVGEQEMADILRAHVRSQRVDLVLAQSRGCRIVAQYLVGGDDPCWNGPVLAVSPAGEWGEVLLSSVASAVSVAACGDDLIELGGSHPVLENGDIERMRVAAAGAPRRAFEMDIDRRGGWADRISELAMTAAEP